MITTVIPFTPSLLRKILRLPDHVEFVGSNGFPLETINLAVRTEFPNYGRDLPASEEPFALGIVPIYEMGETWGPTHFKGWAIVDPLGAYDRFREIDDEDLLTCEACGIKWERPHPMSAFRDSKICCNCSRALKALEKAVGIVVSEAVREKIIGMLEARRRAEDEDTAGRKVRAREKMYKLMDELGAML